MTISPTGNYLSLFSHKFYLPNGLPFTLLYSSLLSTILFYIHFFTKSTTIVILHCRISFPRYAEHAAFRTFLRALDFMQDSVVQLLHTYVITRDRRNLVTIFSTKGKCLTHVVAFIVNFLERTCFYMLFCPTSLNTDDSKKLTVSKNRATRLADFWSSLSKMCLSKIFYFKQSDIFYFKMTYIRPNAFHLNF